MDAKEQYAELTRIIPLGFWLGLAESAGIPYIPAVFSEPFPVKEMYDAIDHLEAPALSSALSWAREYIREQEAAKKVVTFRYECGCTGEAKYAAAYGVSPDQLHPYAKKYREVLVDDPRLFDVTVGETTRVCVRPYAQPRIINAYPVEFRVFFGPDGYQGVSNYYPQRALYTEHHNIMGPLQEAREMARALWQHEKTFHEGFPLGCSMDFVILRNNVPIFLEGGPPHWLGHPSAHPCCFAPGKIDDVALELQEGGLKA